MKVWASLLARHVFAIEEIFPITRESTKASERAPKRERASCRMGRSAGWPAKLCNQVRELWAELDPSQGGFPTVGAKDPLLNDLICDLNKWREEAVGRLPADQQERLNRSDSPTRAIPQYAMKDGSSPPPLGDIKKKKQLSLLTDEFRCWFVKVLEPALEHKVEAQKRARITYMKEALSTAPDSSADNSYSGKSPEDAKEMVKMQIEVFLKAYESAVPDASRTEILEEMLYPDLFLDLDELSAEFLGSGSTTRSAATPGLRLPELAQAAAYELRKLAGGGAEDERAPKRARDDGMANFKAPVYRGFCR